MDFYHKAVPHAIIGNAHKNFLTVSMYTPALLFSALNQCYPIPLQIFITKPPADLRYKRKISFYSGTNLRNFYQYYFVTNLLCS